MARVLVAWASRYGQTGRIAARLQARLEAAGHEVDGIDLGGGSAGADPRGYDACVVGCPIYAGRHLGAVAAFVDRHRNWLNAHPTGLFSVSLSAADAAGSGADDARRVLQSFTAKTGWNPTRVATIAGALPYRRYNVLIRMLMKYIVRKAGGDTDTSRNHEYTDWGSVDEFARELVAAIEGG